MPPPPPQPTGSALGQRRAESQNSRSHSSSSYRRDNDDSNSNNDGDNGNDDRREDDEVERVVSKLTRCHPDDFNDVLSRLESTRPAKMSRRFLTALRRFRDTDEGEKNRLYRLAREALSFFTGTAMDEFVLQMVQQQIFGVSRLHTIVNMNYFEVDPVILLDNVLGDAADGNMVDITARNFSSSEVAKIMRLAAIHSRDKNAILAEMRKSELFENYD